MKTARTLLAALGCLCLVTATSPAQVPNLLNYQGRVAVGTTNFNGTGSFKFALVQGAGPTLLWKNDGSAGNTEPATAVSLTVTKGLYSVLLGDTSLGAGMTAIPASVFTNADVRLRVWFNDGVNGSQLLTPDQRIAAVGYAMVAGSVPDGSITSAKIATGAVTNTQLATNAVQTANIAAGAVGSTQIGNVSIATGNLANSSVTAAKLGSDVGLWSVNAANVFRSGGNVGIGTTPNSKLHVSVPLADAVPGLRVQVDGSSKLTVGSNGGTSLGAFNDTPPANGLYVLGNVGIGSPNPLAALSVGAGSLTDGTVSIQTSTSGDGSERWMGVNKNGDYGLLLGYKDNVGGISAAVVRQVTADPLEFWVNNVTRAMTILSSGSVGIGTPGPSTKLEVAGTVTATAFAGNGAGLTNIPASAVATAPPGMVLIPAGAFTMGNSVAADSDLTNAAPVSTTVSAFYMDVNEVTLSQWQSVYYWAKDNGYTDLPAGSGKGPNHPVQTVSWYDCVKWCNARSEQAGKTPVYYTNDAQTTIYKTGNVNVTNAQVKWATNGYRLPTEAEWEKAARGGRTGQRFPWGNTITQNLANYYGDTTSYGYDQGPNGYHPIGNYPTTSPGTSPVGSFALNGYGLNDMAGNVFEWCWDWYGVPYAGGTDPRGSATVSYRVRRGGSWSSSANPARCADRQNYDPALAFSGIGFRAVLPPGQP